MKEIMKQHIRVAGKTYSVLYDLFTLVFILNYFYDKLRMHLKIIINVIMFIKKIFSRIMFDYTH